MFTCGMNHRISMLHLRKIDPPVRRDRAGNKGVALLELCLITPLFLLLLAGLVQIALTMLTAYNLVAAASEGARVASALPILVVDDSRVRDFIMPKIALSNMYSNIQITNTIPISDGAVVNKDGLDCSRSVSVTVTLRVLMPFQAIFGYPFMEMSRSLSMRYLQQPLCP